MANFRVATRNPPPVTDNTLNSSPRKDIPRNTGLGGVAPDNGFNNALRKKPITLSHFKSVSESRLFSNDMALFKKSLLNGKTTTKQEGNELSKNQENIPPQSSAIGSSELSKLPTEIQDLFLLDRSDSGSNSSVLTPELQVSITDLNAATSFGSLNQLLSNSSVVNQIPTLAGSLNASPLVVSKPKHTISVATAPTNSFYKRELPETCTAFQSDKGRAIFHESITGPYMESYYNLSMHYTTQAEPAYCGLSTLVMILNALQVDPLRQWKGVWRWFDETTLESCLQLETVQLEGITLNEFECIAKCNGLNSVSRRADLTNKDVFMRELKTSCSSASEIMAVSYCRGTLNQTGTGHFSPVGGYNELNNQVLVFDVARFKYTAYWVSADLLWESMHPLDESTGQPRGYCLLSKANRGLVHAAIGRISESTNHPWPVVAKKLVQEIIVNNDIPLPDFDFQSLHPTSESILSLDSQASQDDLMAVNASNVNHIMPLLTESSPLEDVVLHVLEKVPADFFDLTEKPLFGPPFDSAFEATNKERMGTRFPDDMRLHLSQTKLYTIVRRAVHRRQRKLDYNRSCATNAYTPGLHHSPSFSTTAATTQSSSLQTPSAALTQQHIRSLSEQPTNVDHKYSMVHKHTICDCSYYAHCDYFSRIKGHVHTYNDFVAFLTLCVAALVSAKNTKQKRGAQHHHDYMGISCGIGCCEVGMADDDLNSVRCFAAGEIMKEVGFLKENFEALSLLF
ncbi:UNVERIFIED_CONTAM: hypothetical protein HDU68_008323 [Siphonaria sp. JEL0065]|nr:hypothetical protein HDU68_008323 [Siphonaria sp. JEL0065]